MFRVPSQDQCASNLKAFRSRLAGVRGKLKTSDETYEELLSKFQAIASSIPFIHSVRGTTDVYAKVKNILDTGVIMPSSSLSDFTTDTHQLDKQFGFDHYVHMTFARPTAITDGHVLLFFDQSEVPMDYPNDFFCFEVAEFTRNVGQRLTLQDFESVQASLQSTVLTVKDGVDFFGEYISSVFPNPRKALYDRNAIITQEDELFQKYTPEYKFKGPIRVSKKHVPTIIVGLESRWEIIREELKEYGLEDAVQLISETEFFDKFLPTMKL